jgi:hypothetical protein
LDKFHRDILHQGGIIPTKVQPAFRNRLFTASEQTFSFYIDGDFSSYTSNNKVIVRPITSRTSSFSDTKSFCINNRDFDLITQVN